MNSIIKITSAVALMLFSSFTPDSHANYYDDLMAQIDDEFEKAENKYAVISRPMNAGYVVDRSEYVNYRVPFERYKTTEKVLYSDSIIEPWNRTNALALAVSQADIKRVEKFLKVVEDPNDPDLLVRGYKQVYNLVSLSVDPTCPFSGPLRSLEDRLAIIDLLGTTNIDFNFRPEAKGASIHDTESKTPLASSHNVYDAWAITGLTEVKNPSLFECQPTVRARLMLYGADPQVNGTLILDEKDRDDLVERAYQQVRKNENLRERIRPSESIGSLLEQRNNKLKEHGDLSFKK